MNHCKLLGWLKKSPWLCLVLLAIPSTAYAAPGETTGGFLGAIDVIFANLVAGLSQVLFFSIGGMPFIVLWLIVGAIFFTIRMGFINLRAFSHAVSVVRGRYDNPAETGEVTHFQALSAALSATVGLGNIAGVAIAIQTGGPGAVFWMTMVGFFGMSSKFAECSLAQMYRRVLPDGRISGGPMQYLSRGLAEKGLRPLGKILAGVFCVFCIGGSFGGGNMFQANQSYAGIAGVLPFFQDRSWLYGLILACLVALVIVGGIRRIGAVAEILVPGMCLIYFLAALWILAINFTDIPNAIATIVREAFAPQAAVAGGFVGVLATGVRRATFDSEAGVGSAPIAHAAARTEEPIREGVVALLEPFIDTIVVSNMTALAIVTTGAYKTTTTDDGIQLTFNAFSTGIPWFPYLLALAVFLFAFSTILSWGYYGERSWTYLFGERSMRAYQAIYIIFVFIGAVVNLKSVVDFSDMMILSMAFPNLLGCYLLSGKVATALGDYMQRLQTGKMPVFK
ncbi:alanine/glycine:cation symporter family protein [Chroococcidiopsis sp.]|uniref:alanine/glycine:cation symporter family protein n=1 Tax=Chroococcidiopsis sp. TaxID=3088168 RepID=UPI003F2D6FCA